MVFSQMATLTVNVAERAVLRTTSAPSKNKRVRKISVHSDLVPLCVVWPTKTVIAFPEDNRSACVIAFFSSLLSIFPFFFLSFPRSFVRMVALHFDTPLRCGNSHHEKKNFRRGG